MNDDEHDEPDQHDQHVRDLLADLGGARMPAHVTARLEATLADLVAQRPAESSAPGQQTSAPGTNGAVVGLRPRWLPRIVAAAAAVVVLGGGGLAAANILGHTSASTSSASSTARSGSSTASGESAGGSASPQSPASTQPAPSADARRQLTTAGSLPRLSSASLAADVHALLARSPSLGTQSRSAAPSCPGPSDLTGATTRPVLYDGTPALLVLRPAEGGTRQAEVWACSGQSRLASTTVAP